MTLIPILLIIYYLLGIMGYVYIYKTNEHTINVFGENDDDTDELLVNI
jgi:hypothetical protein